MVLLNICLYHEPIGIKRAYFRESYQICLWLFICEVLPYKIVHNRSQSYSE